jgi:hypothetical protein
VLYPWLKPPIRKRRGVRRSPNSNNLPHLKAKIAAIKGRSGSSTGADVVQPHDGQAGPSNSKRPKPDQLAVPANDVQFEARVEGGAVEGGDGEEEEERIITTRRGPIGRSFPRSAELLFLILADFFHHLSPAAMYSISCSLDQISQASNTQGHDRLEQEVGGNRDPSRR